MEFLMIIWKWARRDKMPIHEIARRERNTNTVPVNGSLRSTDVTVAARPRHDLSGSPQAVSRPEPARGLSATSWLRTDCLHALGNPQRSRGTV